VAASRRNHLTDAERAILRILLAAHPAATPRQVALMLRARIGRLVHKNTVLRQRDAMAREAAGLPPAGNPRYHLTAAEREILRQLCLDSAPEYHRGEVTALFLAATGRAICHQRVSQFMRFTLGLPKVHRGSNNYSATRARIAVATTAKRLEEPATPRPRDLPEYQPRGSAARVTAGWAADEDELVSAFTTRDSG
jgi:hypothetical protein